MIGDGWPYLTTGRKIMLILALIGLGYLLWPAGGSKTVMRDRKSVV